MKTSRIYHEKDSTYLRFEAASQKPISRKRLTYKGRVDFIASVNKEDLKSYIVPVEKLPNNEAKLKVDERKNMRYRHHGTLYAKNYDFSNIENIMEEFLTKKPQP